MATRATALLDAQALEQALLDVLRDKPGARGAAIAAIRKHGGYIDDGTTAAERIVELLSAPASAAPGDEKKC